jgi:hypothetical protein
MGNREGVSLDRASLYWYLTCADPGGKLDMGGGILIEIFDSIYGVGRKPRSYIIQSMRTRSVVLKAEVKSTIRA